MKAIESKNTDDEILPGEIVPAAHAPSHVLHSLMHSQYLPQCCLQTQTNRPINSSQTTTHGDGAQLSPSCATDACVVTWPWPPFQQANDQID